ncbi:S-adenosyl-L-methionine-dependent methyltransferase [Fomitiporia mediterranea MF3/22]|uniref:S-adenosyl-L-methionine-dependent methyltransferase n=1 Tax=Fomitiporia mediterranea (strain MF3/22) TaxID=694068 RepID=UPI0004408C13|nr:S-adenosyl-L-methionine-dependent methyltransferase [Fomitiporia mediterranea MF3/22]EJD00244.1 S-adenosyl-L-methionine-dependent methyltransferase [Fomitiporia mediterranea MF3/22]
MATELEGLLDILSSSVNNILGICVKTGVDFPSLNEPAHPSEFSPDGIRNHPEVADNIALAVAAATQLVATLQSPAVHLWNSAFKFTLPVCLGIAEGTHVAEIIRNAGPKGMHVNDIAKKSGVDPKKLERVLRFLATNHYFREVKERTFAHNLLSSLLDTGKDVTDNFTANKYVNTNGFAAIAGYGADEVMTAAQGFREVMLDPKTAFSEEVNDSGFQRAFKTELPLWEFYELPENHYRRDRFNLVMSSANNMHPEAILGGFDWEQVQDGLLVDVGSGIGHVPLEVVKKFPNMQVVLEDFKSVIDKAKNHWNEKMPTHVSAGKVHFIDTDFLKEQPGLPGPPDVFLLRWVLHDWSDKYCIQILKNLRKVAIVGKTSLVIVESVMDYACKVQETPVKETGAVVKSAPAPLLPNFGGANTLSYAIDIIVSTNLNAGERTIQGFINLLESCGWQFSQIRRLSGSKMFWPSIIAIPNPKYNPR